MNSFTSAERFEDRFRSLGASKMATGNSAGRTLIIE